MTWEQAGAGQPSEDSPRLNVSALADLVCACRLALGASKYQNKYGQGLPDIIERALEVALKHATENN